MSLAALVLWAPFCRAVAPPPLAALQPTARIEVAPLGYMPPNSFYLTYRLSAASLGFFDKDHLLFTFRVGGLLKRMPGDPRDDEDQQIRAVVLDASTGKVLQQTEWRMHDRSQYVWPFTDGKFLVRVRDSLYLTDESLTLQPYLEFHTALRGIQISPDRRLLVVEASDPNKLPTPAMGDEAVNTKQPVRIALIPTDSKSPMVVSDAPNVGLVPLMGDGVLDVLEGRQMGSWVVREMLFHGEPKTLAEVKSSCHPTVQPVSATVALVVGCFLGEDDRPVVAISTNSGQELWRDRWANKYVWGWFDYAENGSRFAYESVQANRPISSFDSLYAEDIIAQLVGVYDTETGKLVLVKDASPVLTAGQNVALSRDGRRFAVLRHGAIEVYDLPPVESDRPPAAPKKK